MHVGDQAAAPGFSVLPTADIWEVNLWVTDLFLLPIILSAHRMNRIRRGGGGQEQIRIPDGPNQIVIITLWGGECEEFWGK